MNYKYLENNIFSHEHTIKDTIQLNSLEHMNNEHHHFKEAIQDTDLNFYHKFNQLLNF